MAGPLSEAHEALLRRVAFAPEGTLVLDGLTDKLWAFGLRERGLVTAVGIGKLTVTLTPQGRREAKTTQQVSTITGRTWVAIRLECRVCHGAKPAPFDPPCPHCRDGIARAVCGDHDPPQPLPGCGCFDGSDRAMGFRVQPAEPRPTPTPRTPKRRKDPR